MAVPVIFGLDQLLQYISKCNMSYFKVVVSDSEADKKGSALVSNYDKENQTVDDVRREIVEYCETIKFRGGDFTLWLSSKPRTNAPEFRQKCEIPPAFVQHNMQTSGIGGFSQPHGDVQGMIQEAVNNALDKYKKEQEINELKKKLTGLENELKDSQPGVWGRIIERVEPYLDLYIKSTLPGAKNNVTDSVGSQGRGNDEEVNKIAEESLIKLAKRHPEDLHLLLQKLAKLAETNPQMYQTAINFLNGNG